MRIGREVSRVDANEKHSSDVYPELVCVVSASADGRKSC
jgi:hypothetical protein